MISRVVLVDDVREIRLILRVMLEQSGWFEVVGEAADGEAGIATVAATRPDLVVLDVDMPGRNGWDVLPDIVECAPAAQVVIFSGTLADTLRNVPAERRRLAAAVMAKGTPTGELIDTLLAVVRRAGVASTTASKAVPARVAPGRPSQAWTTLAGAGPSSTEGVARLAALVASSPDAIVATTLDGRIATWNPAAERIYGYTEAEAIGCDVALVVPPDRDGELASIVERLSAGEHVHDLETVHQRSDGARVDIGLTVSLVRAADGSAIGISAIARDLTQRRRADAALSRAVAQLEHQNRELRRSNQELDTFAAIASHDLAQPLQVASGFIEMLQARFGAALDPVAQQWLDASARSLARMRDLVRDILRYARTGDPEAQAAPVELSEAVETALQSLDAVVGERGAIVRVGPLPVVPGHHSQLVQLLQNLIANAIKFVPAGTTPEVGVTAAPTEEGWVVTVSDNGPGIPEADRELVFEMFARGGATDVAGTGLGLAICRKLANRHHGRIWVGSEPGPGASLHLLLPAAPPSSVTGSGDGSPAGVA